MLAQTSPAMKKATVRLMELSADEKARQLYEARRKEQHDIASRERGALLRGRQEGRQEGRMEERLAMAQNALNMQVPMDVVAKLTGLTPEELETLTDKTK